MRKLGISDQECYGEITRALCRIQFSVFIFNFNRHMIHLLLVIKIKNYF